jgi:hypothetical protein
MMTTLVMMALVSIATVLVASHTVTPVTHWLGRRMTPAIYQEMPTPMVPDARKIGPQASRLLEQ